MTKLLTIRDDHLLLCGNNWPNRLMCVHLGLLQLFICLWSLSQHVYSLLVFDLVLKCDFNATGMTLELLFTGVDVIIFDVGLFHSLWGIDGCVAEHLDGGYGRMIWCIVHCLALISFFPMAFRHEKPFHPAFLWPMLQSAYGIGLLILTFAALPRFPSVFMRGWRLTFITQVFVYFLGAGLNFFLLDIYWHWFWHVEAEWNTKLKNIADPLEASNRRIDDSELLTRNPDDSSTEQQLDGEYFEDNQQKCHHIPELIDYQQRQMSGLPIFNFCPVTVIRKPTYWMQIADRI